MGPLESFLQDPLTTDDEFSSLLEALARSNNVGSVSEAAWESAASVAQITASKHEFYDEKSGARYSNALRPAGISGPGVAAQQAVARRDNDESIETASFPRRDGYLLENRQEMARERNCRNQRAARERLKVRFCLLSAQLMYDSWKR
jgi:hypothetical protein